MNLKLLYYRMLLRTKKVQYWLIARIVFAGLALIRLLPAKRALNFVDAAARKLGPLMGRHRTALDNLRHAYPEKSDDELEAIALDMWGNMARLSVEYIFIDQISFIDEDNFDNSNVEVIGLEIFKRLREDPKPHIFFTGHMGNFELLPICAATFGLQVNALYRPPNNPYIAERLAAARSTSSGAMVPSKVGASFALARILDAGGNVGVLVDQKFTGGIPTTFFGRPCETNPLVPKLARQFDCDVHPAFCTRLPGGKFRIEIMEALDLPRADDGRVDILEFAQLMNDTVEAQIRRDPGQWMWFHKRWQIPNLPRRKRYQRPTEQE